MTRFDSADLQSPGMQEQIKRFRHHLAAQLQDAIDSEIATAEMPLIDFIAMLRHDETAPYYALVKNGSVYVKEGEFFTSQGGRTEDWGKSWKPVWDATSIEDARRKAARRYR